MKSLIVIFATSAALLSASCAQKPVVEQAFDPHWADQVEGDHNHEVLYCYQDLLKAKPQAQGFFSLMVDTDQAGDVKSARVVESLEPKFDACVLAKAKTWKYPWFKKAMSGLKDDYHLTLVNNQPMSEFSRPYALGEDLKQTVTNHMPEIRKCYETRHRSVRRLSGKMTVQWTLDSTGKASDITILQSVDPKLDECVTKQLASWKFPPLPTGDAQKVSYPFTFK